MTFSAAVTEVIRSEANRTSIRAVARRLAVFDTTIWRRLRRGQRAMRADLIDAVVATYGLAPIVDRLGRGDRIALYGACERCHEHPKAARGLMRHCSRCRRLTGLRAQAGEGGPSR